jgi:hypothetical protein
MTERTETLHDLNVVAGELSVSASPTYDPDVLLFSLTLLSEEEGIVKYTVKHDRSQVAHLVESLQRWLSR